MPLSPSAISKEIGFQSISQSSRDVKLLCVQRFFRFFAFGASALILVLYMSAHGIDDASIGLFMTLTLLGDVVLSFFLTLFADGLGRRRILGLGCVLMTVSGVIFALSGNFWILLIASIFGVISPSGNEVGPFRAIEESTLAQLSPKDQRSDVFTWYTLIGLAGIAIGQIVCGWLVEVMTENLQWQDVNAYRMVWCLYALLGLAKLAANFGLSSECEAPPPKNPDVELESVAAAEGLLSSNENSDEGEDEDDQNPHQNGSSKTKPHSARNTAETIQSTSKSQNTAVSKIRAMLPQITPESRSIVTKLSILFAIDSFASGLVTLSWLTYFFTTKFALAAGTLGTLFFATSIASAASNLVAASLARRIGLIKTMVFTHLPSAVMLALIPVPNTAWIAMVLLVLRASTSTMDRAPRQAFLAAAVLSHERTAVMGVVNVVKTLAQSAGPGVTGILAEMNRLWIALVVAGGLKAMYDLMMLKMFVSFRGREEEDEQHS